MSPPFVKLVAKSSNPAAPELGPALWPCAQGCIGPVNCMVMAGASAGIDMCFEFSQ